MKVTFPHLGTSHIAVRAILEDLGVDVVAPPPVTRRTIELGARHSPEMACFPLKVSIGNYLEARALGADTVAMLGGIGPCRLGYYADVQARILDDLGAGLEMIVVDPPRVAGWGPVLTAVRRLGGGKSLVRICQALRLGWEKIRPLDELDRVMAVARAVEERPGAAAAAQLAGQAMIDGAATIAGIRRAGRLALEAVCDVRQRRRDGVRPLTIGIVGEIYMVLEPRANLELEDRLGRLGVVTRRALYVTDWVRRHLVPPPFRSRVAVEADAAARPYLNHFVGGEGVESVGRTVLFAREGLDGVIHVSPLTCMPEIVAASVLPQAARDLDIPVMSLFLDEHSGETGVQTRLEAFVDLLWRRRLRRGKGRGALA